jgi:hypothetical protein
LDASAVVRIIEGSPQAAAFQQAPLDAELVLAPELMLTEVSNALWRLQRAEALLRSWITSNPTVTFRWKHWHWRVIGITRFTTASIWLWRAEKRPCCSRLIKS